MRNHVIRAATARTGEMERGGGEGTIEKKEKWEGLREHGEMGDGKWSSGNERMSVTALVY